MKRYNELITDAETIRDETATGQNTAARVGGHLADIVERTLRPRMQPDSENIFKAFRPTVCFKFDSSDTYWGDMIAENGPLEQLYGTPVPCTFFIAAERVSRPKIMDITDIEFTPAATDGAGNLLTNAYITGSGFTDSQIAAGNIISFVGTDSNDNVGMLIRSVNEAKTIITLYSTAYYTSGAEYINGDCVAETITGGSVEMYRGNHSAPTYATLKSWVDNGHQVGAYNRTGRPNNEFRGWPAPSDPELWEEIYGAKRDLDAGLAAAGSSYRITQLISPGGGSSISSNRMARQAGYKSVDAKGYNQTNNLHNPTIIHPWQFEELNTNCGCHIARAGTVATSGDYGLTGSGTAFATDFDVGDPIVVGDVTHSTFRIIATIESETALTVTVPWASAMSGKSIYDPQAQTPTPGVSYGSQSVCGFINHILSYNGVLVIAGHDGLATKTLADNDCRGVALRYIKWLQDNGTDIVLTDMSSAFDAYAPYIDGGTHFSVSEDGVRINRAKSTAFTIETPLDPGNTSTYIGYGAGAAVNGQRNTFIGAYAGYSNLGSDNAGLGRWASSNNSGSYCVMLGEWAGAGNTKDKCIGIGYEALYNNTGNNCVAIGYKTGYGNSENNVFLLGYDTNTPLIKGYFNTGAIILGCPATAVADGLMGENRFTFYLDETTNKLKFKVRYQDSGETPVYKTGEIALT